VQGVAAGKARELAIAIAAGATPNSEDYRVDPPYTPNVKRLSVGYTTSIEVTSSAGQEADELLHVHPFGVSRIPEADATFFPRYDAAGELYIGLRELYTRKREVFLHALRATGLAFTEPQGAYYVLLDISPLGFATDTEAAEWFVREIGVAGVPGSSFFREPEHRYLRLHFAKREETLLAAGECLRRLAHGR